MKKPMSESIEIPSGISCEFANKSITCTKDGVHVKRVFNLPGIKISVADSKVTFSTEAGNKNEFKRIKSSIAHVKNLFTGLNEKYVYELEACNVHFPMTLKIDADKLLINNFLGEKIPRKAKILPGVTIDIKGAKITLTSNNRDAAGQTAANIEKATLIRNRDRRIFQDGIYIVSRPGAKA